MASHEQAHLVLIVKLVCKEGWFRFAHEEALACSLVCRAWREALRGSPIEDNVWRDLEWVQQCFPPRRSFWRLRALRLKATVPSPARTTDKSLYYYQSQAKAHRLDRELKNPLAKIVQQLRHLTTLSLRTDFCKANSLAALQVCTALEHLQLGSTACHVSLDFLQNCTKLKSLEILDGSALRDLDALSTCCPRLETLIVRQGVRLLNVDGLRGCKSLKTIDLTGALKLRDIEGLTMCTKVESCTLVRCLVLRSIAPLQECTKLKTLSLTHCGLLSSIEVLQNKHNLQSLWLAHCRSLKDLQCLARCSSLQTLSICNCPELFHPKILEPVLQLDHVKELYASGMQRGILDAKASRRVAFDSNMNCSVFTRWGEPRFKRLRVISS
mmetsp:Transcript_599/g.1535  ORF Transcript_599/g.1535 Transcript_599/m.1535 type:complete len:383 (-) Transcript_599:433-1581(-)